MMSTAPAFVARDPLGFLHPSPTFSNWSVDAMTDCAPPPDWRTLSRLWSLPLEIETGLADAVLDGTTLFDPGMCPQPGAPSYYSSSSCATAPHLLFEKSHPVFESPLSDWESGSGRSSVLSTPSCQLSPLPDLDETAFLFHSPPPRKSAPFPGPPASADIAPSSTHDSAKLACRVLLSAGVFSAPPLPHTDPAPDANAPRARAAPFTGAAAPSTPRPKTSSPTERRYRSNLHARILALRAAVPALRVLDRRALSDPSSSAPVDLTDMDVIDAEGMVDGVKVARKNSKAAVLLKATEYIHVLKSREKRYEREVAGLKALVRLAVGGGDAGDRVVEAWESEWVARGDDPAVSGAGEDDGEDDGEDSDDVVGARKKPRTDALRPLSACPPQVTRKRGRPRKTAPSPPPFHSIETSPNAAVH
ncbi:unnamed protein product [Mycena citricolor]|uniref:BHLH domain-containing protein n=1 Tax=Mycena citricolor TaxID=2018698 RepID=A0AAD2HDK3_9AGAR|nr:unnamed protein product [Mycena citricolor]